MGVASFRRTITAVALCCLAQAAAAGASKTLRDNSTGARALGPSFGLKIGDVAFFGAYDGTKRALWRSDGTPEGTHNLGIGEPVTISNGTLVPSSGPFGVVVGNVLVYTGYTSEHKAELWRTDGTVAGTSLLLDLSDPNQFGSLPSGSRPGNCGAGFVSSGTHAFYGVSANGAYKLYRTDGTTAGTIEIGSYPSNTPVCVLGFHGTTLYFEVRNPPTYPQATTGVLWRSNGEPGGHQQITDASGTPLPSPANLVEMNGSLYFFSRVSNQPGLWRLAAGDHIAQLVVPRPSTVYSSVIAAAAGNVLFFRESAPNGISTEMHMYRSDGTVAGTYAVSDSASPNDFKPNGVVVGGRFFYFCALGTRSADLCVTDGSLAGTTSIRIKVPGDLSARQPDLLEFDGEAYFTIDTFEPGVIRSALWHSDGTSSGTKRVKEVPDVTLFEYGSHLTAAGNRLLLAGIDQSNTDQLWVYDPAASGGGTMTWLALMVMASLLAYRVSRRSSALVPDAARCGRSSAA